MSVASISLLSVVAVLCSMFAVSASTPTGLRLDSYSEDQVKGCYIHNQTLGVCFELEKDSMKITKTNGEEVVFYTKLDHDMFYYQILDQGFIGWVFLNLNLIRFATAQTTFCSKTQLTSSSCSSAKVFNFWNHSFDLKNKDDGKLW